ncbi:condensation domain-containing protein, partial [Streptomyces sp. 7-21]|uniref:condensation domain-containing protein n=1 Tax=Streptomyces sp. 7-21 TaxID=2802283 RepID=UPI001A4D3B44
DGLVVTPRQVFDERTPGRLAAVAEAPVTGARENDEATGDVTATPVMREAGEWSLRARFAQWVIVTTPGGLALDAVAHGWQAVAEAHPMLRARAVPGGGLVAGDPSSPAPAGLVARIDATAAAADDLDALAQDAAREAAAALDPARGVVARLAWLDAGPDRLGRLAIVVHHLVVDGVSWRVLTDDVAEAVRAVAAGTTPALVPEGTSFRTWAAAAAAQAVSSGRTAELDSWTALAADAASVPGLPAPDPVRDVAASMRRRVWRLPAGVADDLVGRV